MATRYPVQIGNWKVNESKYNIQGLLNLIEQAIKHEPKSAFLWFGRGMIFLQQGKENKAMTSFVFAFSLDIATKIWISEYPQLRNFSQSSSWQKFEQLTKELIT